VTDLALSAATISSFGVDADSTIGTLTASSSSLAISLDCGGKVQVLQSRGSLWMSEVSPPVSLLNANKAAYENCIIFNMSLRLAYFRRFSFLNCVFVLCEVALTESERSEAAETGVYRGGADISVNGCSGVLICEYPIRYLDKGLLQAW